MSVERERCVSRETQREAGETERQREIMILGGSEGDSERVRAGIGGGVLSKMPNKNLSPTPAQRIRDFKRTL